MGKIDIVSVFPIIMLDSAYQKSKSSLTLQRKEKPYTNDIY